MTGFRLFANWTLIKTRADIMVIMAWCSYCVLCIS